MNIHQSCTTCNDLKIPNNLDYEFSNLLHSIPLSINNADLDNQYVNVTGLFSSINSI